MVLVAAALNLLKLLERSPGFKTHEQKQGVLLAAVGRLSFNLL